MIALMLAAALVSTSLDPDDRRDSSAMPVRGATIAPGVCSGTSCHQGSSPAYERMFAREVRQFAAEGRCDRALARVRWRPGSEIQREIRATCAVEQPTAR
jgi:hypothetical protein